MTPCGLVRQRGKKTVMIRKSGGRAEIISIQLLASTVLFRYFIGPFITGHCDPKRRDGSDERTRVVGIFVTAVTKSRLICF